MANPFSAGAKLVSEALVKPVVDEGQKAVETGVQSVTGSSQPPKDPKKEQEEKQQEEMKKRNILQFFNALKANQQSSIQQEQYLKTQKTQEEIQEKQQVKQFEIAKKEQKKDESLFRAQRRSEIKSKGG